MSDGNMFPPPIPQVIDEKGFGILISVKSGSWHNRTQIPPPNDPGIQRRGEAPSAAVPVKATQSMVRSSWVYKQLKRFRAGIEGCIGTLKHTFGLHRCSWKGWPHFQSYVHASVLTYNLVVLARLLL